MLRAVPVSASLSAFAREKLAGLERRDARRVLRAGAGDARTFCHQHQTYLAFASNDYLGLAGHPEVVRAAHAGLEALGAGAIASRLVVGNHSGYEPLESELAQLKQTQAACVFGSGYHANLGIVPALTGPEDGVFIDSLAHACLFSGARLSRAKTFVFEHNNTEALAALLGRERSAVRHAMVLTEGIFSMDGDRAPLPRLAELCQRHDTWLLVDDAHATGVIGPNGAGSTADFGLTADAVPIQVGTLSKSFGAYGGFVCGSQDLINLLVTRARTLIYSTGLPPSVIASARQALEVSKVEPWRRKRARNLAQRVASGLGLRPPDAAVIPIPVGSNAETLRVHGRLLERGLWVPAMRPPTVPEGTARLRVSVSAAHSDEDIERLVEALQELQRDGSLPGGGIS